jgi:DNA-binding PadR family transcriptional regulator
MSTRAVILGLLRERPLHGYEIKQIIESHMSDWTSIAFGSIYFALDKLSDEGLIEKASVEQQGNRPSRSIFRITGRGREEFLLLLRQTWNDVERTYFSLDIGLFFISALPADEVREAVRGRIAGIEAARARLMGHEKAQLTDESIPAVAKVIFSHSLSHLEAELSWTKELLERMEQGGFA